MKKTYRRTALLLSLLLLSASLASCADTDEQQTEPAAPAVTEPVETVDPNTVDNLPAADFNGYSFIVRSCNTYGFDSATRIMFDEITGDPINDELFASKCAVEDRFNVQLSFGQADSLGETGNAFRSSVNAGDHSFDLLLTQDQEAASLGRDGFSLNLFDIPQFDFSKPWWPKNAVESFRLGQKLYSASSYLSYLGLHWTRVLTINKDFAAEISMDLPYDTVRAGDWTLDTFYSTIDGVSWDVDGNGKINNHDRIALTSGGQTGYCLQEAVELPIYRHDADGLPVLDLDIERAQTYIEIVRKIFHSDDYYRDGNFGVNTFNSGAALFAYTQVGDAYDTFRLNDIKYGFLPTPKFDENQENYINCCTDMPWCMPKTVVGDDVVASATIIEALSCRNYNHVLPAYYEGAIKSRIADAPDDTEMLQLIADTRTVPFGFTYALPLSNLVDDCVINGKEVASHFKANEKSAARALESLVQVALAEEE